MVLADAEQGLDRVFTAPNLLSVLRLGLVAWCLAVLFASHARTLAAVLLAVAGATDFLDGYVARRFHQVTNLGKVLDPTVDRIVTATAVFGVVIYGAVPIWLAAVVLGREFLVSVMGIVLAVLGASRIDVLFIGKVAAFGLMCAFPLFLLGDGHGSFDAAVTDAAWVIAVPSVAASLAAAAAYVPLGRRALAAGRTGSLEAGVR